MAQLTRFRPLLERVLVERLAPEAKTKGGVIIPLTAQSKVNEGIVKAIAKDVDNVAVDDHVLLPEYGGTSLSLDDKEYYLYKKSEILGVVEKSYFVKNILMAMISRMKGYKVRDGKFQYGFNLPIPDPFIRNYHNVIDETQESKTEVVDKDDTFIPRSKPSLENAEQQAAFAYACAKRPKIENVLTVKLLYETLRENPQILGLHELQSVNLFKLSLQLDD
jgi:chaperonin GroES